MEVYLNSIEMGPNIYGAEALVAATLPNPIRFSSLSPTKYMRKRQQQIQREMRLIPFLNKSK